MTRDINKRLYSILIAILCAFCWLATPAAATNLNDSQNYFAEGAMLTYNGDNDAQQARSINSLLLTSLSVYALGIDEDGNASAYRINDEYGYAQGPANILNCTVPQTFYQGMIDLGFEYYYNVLTFSVSGSNIYRVVLEVDGETVIDSSLSSSGNYTVTWATPRTTRSSYNLIVYSNNVSATAWGHITVA